MELVETLNGGAEIVAELCAEWITLCEEGASNHPFLRPEWFLSFVANFEKEILLLTVRRAGLLCAILPLVQKRAGLHGIPVSKLQSVFNLNTQRFDLVHGTDESERKVVVQALWDEIKRQSKWKVLEIRMVDKNSWLNDLLIIAGSENYPTGIWRMENAPFIKLPQAVNETDSCEEYFKSLGKKRRQDLSRRLRRLREIGSVEFAVTRGYSAELMRKYFDLEAKGWKGRAGTAVADDDSVVKLHDDFARATAEKNALFVYELKLNDQTIAMQLRIVYNRQTTCWKTAYDENYARFSPGNLLFAEFVRDSLKNHSQEVDLLSPPSASKGIWASGERELVGFYIFQRGIIGWLLWKWKFSVISRLRKFKNKTPLKTAE